jgi:hypothetical protein
MAIRGWYRLSNRNPQEVGKKGMGPSGGLRSTGADHDPPGSRSAARTAYRSDSRGNEPSWIRALHARVARPAGLIATAGCVAPGAESVAGAVRGASALARVAAWTTPVKSFPSVQAMRARPPRATVSVTSATGPPGAVRSCAAAELPSAGREAAWSRSPPSSGNLWVAVHTTSALTSASPAGCGE